MRRVSYDVRLPGARSSAHGLLDRGLLAAGLVAVSTVLGWVLLAAPANADGVPMNISPPTILGAPQEGQTLTEVNGSWTNQPTSYSYRWQRCDSAGSTCSEIPGASTQTYTLTGVDVGYAIVVKEIAHNAAGHRKAVSAPTAVVSPAPASPNTNQTVTTLLASPTDPVVNEAVTLVASVTSSDSAAAPSGAVTFLNGASTIAGCANEPVDPHGQSVIVTCQTWFIASMAQLAAVFSPSAGATMAGSASPTVSLMIGRDASSTSLDVSKTVGVGASTTYTATVNSMPGRLGTMQPTGTVEFLDGGQTIASCTNEQLTNAGATCTVRYNTTGSHNITAQYGGDANFGGSSAPAQPVNVIQPPPRVLGFISSTMQWTFDSTSTYTKVLRLVVNGASGSTVTMSCHDRGCPFARKAMLVAKTRRCAQKPTHTCPARGTIDLAPRFLNRRLSVGAQITVVITRPGWIGKYYQFTVRAGRPPHVQIACLAPGAIRPGFAC
jgi:Bacterial Ig-like domain (group 3)